MNRILVTKRIPYLDPLPGLLSEAGEVYYGTGIDEPSVLADATGATVIVATKDAAITRKVIRSTPRLKVVATSTAGYDWVDVDAATEAGVCVIANTGAAADTVASFAVGLILALTRRIVWGDRALRAGEPYPAVRDRLANQPGPAGIELDGGRVGVVGLGAIGGAVARKVRDFFPVAVLAYDPYASAETAAANGITLMDDLTQLCRVVDVLLVHAALTPQTRHLVGRTQIDAMKPGAYLVNCSRGAIVDEAALIDALREGRLAGAAVDVFEKEPLPSDSPLLRLDNVIATPHIAGVTTQSDGRRASVIADRIRQALSGVKPMGLVNPTIWPQHEKNAQERTP